MLNLIQKTILDNHLPLSLAEVKEYLKITDANSDELLLKFIDAAILEFESYTGKTLRAYQAKFIKKGHFYKIKMPTKFAMIKLIIVNQFAQEQELSEKNYTIDGNTIVLPRISISAEITCNIEPEIIDERLRIILLKMVARLFLKRETEETEGHKTLNSYREMRL